MNLHPFSWFKQTRVQAPARTFNFRLQSTHSAPSNAVDSLQVERYVDEEWQSFDLHLETRGFQIFVYSCFICQHTYLRMNATEQGLMLDVVKGTFKLATSEAWQVLSVDADFKAYLTEGHADVERTHYLMTRMKGCPVSRNLGKDVVNQTRLTIHASQEGLNIPRPSRERSLHVYNQKRLTDSTLRSFNSSDL